MLKNFWKVCATMNKNAINILKSEYPDELADKLIDAYNNAIREYKKRNWKYFGNEMGRFVEVAIRMVELKTAGKYTNLKDKLATLNENKLKQFEQSQITKNISFRILIPRQLFVMYTIRNKRGMIHINEVDPNYMDATALLNISKWVLAEFVRNSKNIDYDDAIKIIEELIAKENMVIWIEEDIFKILDTHITLEEKILCILYYKNNICETELFKLTEYSNITIFKKKLKKMHTEQKINYTKDKITISPIGINLAEDKLNKIGKK
jgi:hypothetical protein|nr:MAG TPA: hypothetical protein [Bacteriophage sp.]